MEVLQYQNIISFYFLMMKMTSTVSVTVKTFDSSFLSAHTCDVKGSGQVIVVDADQKLTRKKYAVPFGVKEMFVGETVLKANTGCLKTPMQSFQDSTDFD